MGKFCTKCGEYHDIGDFYWRSYKITKNYAQRDTQCKFCKIANSTEWGRQPHAILSARQKHLQKMYGITLEQYDEMVLESENRCAICERDIGKKPYVDHDHKTGKVRGLLCSPCNTALGLLQDSSSVVRAAYKYLEHHSEVISHAGECDSHGY